MKLFKTAIVALICCINFTSFAQQTYQLDLETSINIAKQKSYTMLILKENLKKAAFDLKAATSSFKTRVELDILAPQYTETLRTWEDSSGISSFMVKQNRMNSYLTISQRLPTDGSLFINSGVQNFIDINKERRQLQLSTSIGYRQPLSAFYIYNRTRSELKQVKLAYEKSLKRLKRSELDLVYDVSQTFFNLISTQERLNIAQLSMTKQKEAFEIAQNKYKAGLIREVEALQMEVDLSEAINNHDIAKVNFQAQTNLLKEKLGLNLADSISVNNEMKYTEVIVNADQAVQYALQNRLELKENEIEIELAKMQIKRQRSVGMINGDFSVNYDFFGVDNSDVAIPIETSFRSSWDRIQSEKGNLIVGLRINIPLIDWGENRARVNAAKAVLNQSQLELDAERVTIERDTRSTVDRIQSSLRRLQLLEKNVLVAEKSFEISRQRYTNGDIDSQAMALERERLNNAYISRLESFTNYKLMLSDLMRKTFYDFESNRSLLDM